MSFVVAPSARDVSFDAFDRAVGEAAGLRNAADARLVAMVQECMADGWWQAMATTSPLHWCKVRLGVGPATAAKLVRCAEELTAFPHVAEAFGRGELSLDQVHVMVTTAHPRYDKDLADSGRTWDVVRMRRIIRNFSIPRTPPEPDVASGAEPADFVRAGWTDGGRFQGAFDVGPVLGAAFEKALGAARNRVFTARTGVDAADDDRTVEPAAVSRVDAFERLVHAALDGLDGSVAAARRPSERLQVVVHVDGEHPERAQLHLGPLLPASVAAELLCDADLRLAVRRHGRVVALHRRRRTVDEALRTVIEARDDGCRVDGCDRRGFLHVHHLVHWKDGGPTDPSNLVCVCPEHHRLLHAGGIRLVGDPTRADGLVTVDARGRPLPRPGPVPPAVLPPASAFAPTHRGRAMYSLPAPRQRLEKY